MKSQHSASSQPPPNATPLTAAITGTDELMIAIGAFLDDGVLRAPVVVAHALAFLQVAARAERLVAGPGEHDAAQVARA